MCKLWIAMLCISVLVLCGCKIHSQSAERSFFALDTYITIQADGPQTAVAAVEKQIQSREQQWSVTNPDSEIYAVNHGGGKPITVSEDTARLLSFALDMSKSTEGALDPTIYPVLTAWGFTTGSYHVPTGEELHGLLASVDYQDVHLQDNTITIPDRTQIDLGAVAKGYIGDEIAELLQQYGVTSALINLGGNIHAIGSKPDGSPWRIGIREPFADGNLGVLEAKNIAVVTSGGYERYFTDENGNIYWHILDPQTGYPAETGIMSITIVSPSGKLCDALSTALFVLGPEQAVDYWRSQKDFDMLLVMEDGSIWLTEGLEDIFTIYDSNRSRVVIRYETE